MKFLTTVALIITCFAGFAQESISTKNYVEYQVNISPNPTDGPIKIEAPAGATCKLVSLKGVYIGTWQIEGDSVIIENLQPGQFIASIEFEGRKTTKKIVVL